MSHSYYMLQDTAGFQKAKFVKKAESVTAARVAKKGAGRRRSLKDWLLGGFEEQDAEAVSACDSFSIIPSLFD